MAKGTTVTMYSRANDTHANNIGSKEAWGHKRRENLFVNSFVGTSAGGVSYVNSKTRSTNDSQGAMVNTNAVSDIGIDGAGMLIVSDTATGTDVYTRRGDFRQDELGFWKNGGGQLLKAWKLDGEGNLPQNSSLLSSLEAVNFANTKGSPVATTVISIAMNLNAGQEALRGGGITEAKLNLTGLNKATTSSDILFPEAAKGFNLGDVFTFRSLPNGAEQKIKFGGLVVGNQPTLGDRILGASSATTSFNFNPIAGADSLVSGESKLTIDVNGTSYTFTAVQGANNTKNKTFSTIQGLADAINNVSSLQARVDEYGRLYVAPTEADSNVTFAENGGAGNLRAALGLTNLPNAAFDGGVTRFNSLDTLRSAVNTNQGTNSLKATIDGTGFKITSLLSTDDFTISGESLGVHKITSASLNPGGTETGRGQIFINAPSHGLQIGDFVRTVGALHAQAPAGIYMVSAKNDNGFVINLTEDASAFPAAAQAGPLAPVLGATWQKTVGQKFPTRNAQITAAAGPGNSQNLTIASANHGLQVNDVIYVDGGTFLAGGRGVTLPSGYYHVTAAADANTFTIVATTTVAPPVGGGPFVGDTFNFRKIGTTAAGAFGGATHTFDTNVFESDGIAGDRYIRTYIPSHNYTKGDFISFKDLPEPIQIDGINLVNGFSYKVTDYTADTVMFKVFDVNGAQQNNGGNGNGVAGAVAMSALNPDAFSINNFSRLFEFFSINQDQITYDKTYDAANIEKNLISGNLDGEKFPHPLRVYDSLGDSHTVLLNFAKLKNNQWAVEISAQKDKDGIYDLANAGKNGLIANGTLAFDENGGIKIGEISNAIKKIKLAYRNGAAPGEVTIDWENALSDIKSGTVSQNKNKNNVEILQGNGQAAGTLEKLAISPEGFVIGTFDSGESRKLYQIPLALFANVNGLIAGSNDVFEISRESGELLLKAAGVGGAGRTLGGILEASNTDSTKELLSVQELSNTIRANARVAATTFKNIQTILSELNN